MTHYLAESLSNWLTIKLTHFLTDSLSNWLTIKLTHYQIDSLSYWLTILLTHYLTDSLSNWLTIQLTQYLADLLSNWPLDGRVIVIILSWLTWKKRFCFCKKKNRYLLDHGKNKYKKSFIQQLKLDLFEEKGFRNFAILIRFWACILNIVNWLKMT